MGKPNINGCKVESVNMLSRKCRKCMYKDYCKERKNEAALFNTAYGPQIVTVPYETSIIPASAGISADEAIEAIQKSMIIWNRLDGR